MKRFVCFLLLLCLTLLSLVSCGGGGDEEESKLSKQYSQGLAYEVSATNSAECIITGIGSCTDKNIVIPSYINGMRVAGIADGAFSPKSELGEAVAKRGAVAGATAVKATAKAKETPMSLISSVVTGNVFFSPSYAFSPSDMGEGYETGDGEPIALEDIESVQIPPTVQSIGEEAFYGCEDLGAINTHAALSAIGKDAFKETAYYNNPVNWEGQALYLSNYLINVSEYASGEITVREGTTMIADSAFYKCVYVTSVNFSTSVTKVGDAAFYGCTNLTYAVYSPGSNLQFAANAFEGCISYVPFTPGVVPGGTPSDPNAYDEIDEQIFENAKKNPKANNTYEMTTVEGDSKKTEIIKTNGTDSYYMSSSNGDTEKEIYVCSVEWGTITYGWFGDGLYITTATIPEPIGIPEELHFADLTPAPSEDKTNIYTYETDGSTRVEFGFRNTNLVYMQIVTDEYTVTISYYDFDKTEVPMPGVDLADPTVVVDQNGNPI